jgi:hypothetical protein
MLLQLIESYLKQVGILCCPPSSEYNVFLSPRVMGLSRYEVLEKIQPFFYRNVINEGIELLRFGSPTEVAK